MWLLKNLSSIFLTDIKKQTPNKDHITREKYNSHVVAATSNTATPVSQWVGKEAANLMQS